VGRMVADEQYKGQDVLIRSLPLIARNLQDVQLVLVGDGDDSPRLESLSRSQATGIQEAFFMPGYVQDELL